MENIYTHRFEWELRNQICHSWLKQENMNNMNTNNMEKLALSAMYLKPCLLFPMHLILLH